MLIIGSSLFNLSRTFVGAVLILYLLDKGIDLSTIGLAKSLQLGVSILLTVPAGKFADKYGNKISVVLACLFATLYFILLLHPSNTLLILAEIINGLSIAFYMGAYEAWLFSQKHEQESTYHVYSKSQEYIFIAVMMAGLCGAMFSSLALYMSIAMLLVTSLVFLSCKETKTTPSDIVEPSKNTTVLTKEILLVSIPPVVFGGFIQVAYQLWPAYMIQPFINATQKQLGIVFVLMMLGQFALSKLSKLIKGFSKKRLELVGISSIFLLCTLLAPLLIRSSSPGLIISGILLIITMSFSAVTFNILFTHACDTFEEKSKSTSISYLDALIRGLAGIVLFAGYVVKSTNISFYWLIFLLLFWMVLIIHIFGLKSKYYAQRQSSILD